MVHVFGIKIFWTNAQRSRGCSILGSVWSQVGWGLERPGLVEGVLPFQGVGLRWALRSLPTHLIPWFWDFKASWLSVLDSSHASFFSGIVFIQSFPSLIWFSEGFISDFTAEKFCAVGIAPSGQTGSLIKTPCCSMGRMQTVLLSPSLSPTVLLFAPPLLNCHAATEHVPFPFGNCTDLNRECQRQENSAPAKLLEIILSSCVCITWQLMRVFGQCSMSKSYFRGLFFVWLS